jgi:formylglycine-generating enzyme required for sulfatase activity
LETIILKALAKDPQDRYGDAAEMAADLRRRLAGSAVEPGRAGRTHPLKPALWRQRYRLMGAGVLAVAVLVTVLALRSKSERGSLPTDGTAGMAVAPAVTPASAPVVTPASMPALTPTSARASAPAVAPPSVPASAPASAPAVPRASPPVGALPSKEQLAAADEQGAQQRLAQLESSVDSQAYSRAYWVLRTLREHYAHTQVVKQAGAKLARLAVPILANVDEKKLTDRQQYWLAPPPQTAAWTDARRHARQLLEKEADTCAGVILLRVVLQDEQAENGYQLRANGATVSLADKRWRRVCWRSSGDVLILGRKKGDRGATRANIEIGALHHFSPTLDLDFREGQVVELGELVVGLPPRSARGTLMVTVRPEATFKATGARVVLGRLGIWRESSRWALDAMNRCVVTDLAAGECSVRCEGTLATPERNPPAAVIRAGAITEVTLAALARRSVEIEWRFRDAANEGAWRSGVAQILTGEGAWIPRNQGGATRCRLAVSDWDGSQCNIGAQDAHLLRLPKAEFPADSDLPTDEEFQRAAGQPAQRLEVGAVYVVRPMHGAWQAVVRVRSLGVAALAEPGVTEPAEDSDEPPPEEDSPRVRESLPPAKPGEVAQPQQPAPIPAPAVPSPHAAASKKELTLDLGGGAMLELVLIPAGDFMMGSPDSEQGRDSGEGPRHPVRISRAFYMGKYEVTQAQWRAVMGADPSNFQGDDQLPVDTVSWDMCREFCRRLSERMNRPVRLPTEAEWEYACRAGSTGRFCFGDSEGQLRAYAWDYTGSGGKTHPVGGKQANAWGLYDMHGNVCEWCEDVWHEDYAGAPADGSAWRSGGDASRYVQRGGSWTNVALRCRSACRYTRSPDSYGDASGFRVVVGSDDAPPEESSPPVGESPPPAKPGEVAHPRPPATAPAPAAQDSRATPVAPSPHAAASQKELTLDLGGRVMLELVLIPAGEFMMGSPDSEQGRDSGEGPLHPVRISRAFYMGKHEVTQAQWQAIMGTNPSWFSKTGGGKDNVSEATTATLPVDRVSWEMCQKFCRRASQETGRTVRLPTEAEWEYACRAGSTGRFCFGDSDEQLGAYAWHRSNSGGKTHPVGGKQANAWGLYDMHGNVWEWCQDSYGPYSSGAQENPSDSDSGRPRVMRGGDWGNNAVLCRSAGQRRKEAADNRHSYVGFRVVVDAK